MHNGNRVKLINPWSAHNPACISDGHCSGVHMDTAQVSTCSCHWSSRLWNQLIHASLSVWLRILCTSTKPLLFKQIKFHPNGLTFHHFIVISYLTMCTDTEADWSTMIDISNFILHNRGPDLNLSTTKHWHPAGGNQPPPVVSPVCG